MTPADRADNTCDPALTSWVASANQPDTAFPIQNLPYGVFCSNRSGGNGGRLGLAIGDQVLDLHSLADAGLLAGIVNDTADACRSTTLNTLASLGRARHTELRQHLSALLQAAASPETQSAVAPYLLPQSSVTMALPFTIGDYTDFYSSIEHATRVGRLFRPEAPLLPNYKHVPIAYHGRASSVVVSGTPVLRPSGQQLSDGAPIFAPTQRLDYEAELALFVGTGNRLGSPIAIAEAEQHIFGLGLLNDWSARDIQSWEYQPLGPFLGKSFATTVSPWIVPLDALAPFRAPARQRNPGDPSPLPYLTAEHDQATGNLDIQLEVRLLTPLMRERNQPAALLSTGNATGLYWTPAQWIAHHTGNGCNLRPGDLLGSGTLSGEGENARACLLELTGGGAQPVFLPNGEHRTYLHDGDEITLTAFCRREGYRRIGFGSCSGRIQPARA